MTNERNKFNKENEKHQKQNEFFLSRKRSQDN